MHDEDSHFSLPSLFLKEICLIEAYLEMAFTSLYARSKYENVSFISLRKISFPHSIKEQQKSSFSTEKRVLGAQHMAQ